MSNDKKYIKRDNYHGPVYDVDHLATFTVGSKLGKYYFIILKAKELDRVLTWEVMCYRIINLGQLVFKY